MYIYATKYRRDFHVSELVLCVHWRERGCVCHRRPCFFVSYIYLIRRRLELPTEIALVYFAILFSFSVFYPLQLFALHTLFSH